MVGHVLLPLAGWQRALARLPVKSRAVQRTEGLGRLQVSGHPPGSKQPSPPALIGPGGVGRAGSGDLCPPQCHCPHEKGGAEQPAEAGRWVTALLFSSTVCVRKKVATLLRACRPLFRGVGAAWERQPFASLRREQPARNSLREATLPWPPSRGGPVLRHVARVGTPVAVGSSPPDPPTRRVRSAVTKHRGGQAGEHAILPRDAPPGLVWGPADLHNQPTFALENKLMPPLGWDSSLNLQTITCFAAPKSLQSATGTNDLRKP